MMPKWQCPKCSRTGNVPKGVAITCGCGYVEIPEEQPSDYYRLGDVFSAFTRALRIPECGRCKRRKRWLNRLIKRF